MSVGVLLGLMVTLMSDVIGMALMDAGVEDPSSLAHDLEIAGSVFFYFTVVAMILHCLNMISGLFRGNIVEEESKMSSSIVVDTYDLASATTVRRILSSGAGMDTMVVPVGESDESGSATDL
jgi:tellurite resistance protein TehA-like permease